MRYDRPPLIRRAQSLRGLLSGALLPACLLALVACGAGPAAGGDEDEPPTALGLSLHGLNYTDVPIGVFYVNGSWGGSVTPYAAGLSSAGSARVPYPWRPGVKVRVKWQDDLLYAKDPDALMTAEVEVPPYPRIYSGYLWVAFFPGNEVKVYASGVGPGHPEFPDGLKNPGEYCQEQPGCIEWYRSDQPPREGHY